MGRRGPKLAIGSGIQGSARSGGPKNRGKINFERGLPSREARLEEALRKGGAGRGAIRAHGSRDRGFAGGEEPRGGGPKIDRSCREFC